MFCLFRVSRCLYLLSAQKIKNNISRGEKTTLTQHPSIHPSVNLSTRPVIHSSIQFSTSSVYSLSAITIIPPTTTIVTTDSCGQLLLGFHVETISKHDICNDSLFDWWTSHDKCKDKPPLQSKVMATHHYIIYYNAYNQRWLFMAKSIWKRRNWDINLPNLRIS